MTTVMSTGVEIWQTEPDTIHVVQMSTPQTQTQTNQQEN